MITSRNCDYQLGGKDNYAADREQTELALKVYPEWAFTARANRAYLGRVVRFLAGEAGISADKSAMWCAVGRKP